MGDFQREAFGAAAGLMERRAHAEARGYEAQRMRDERGALHVAGMGDG